MNDLHPFRDLAPLLERAQQATARGDATEAEQLFTEVLNRGPGNAVATSYLAASAMARGDAVRAVALFRQALSVHPDDAALRLNLAHALERSNHLDEARGELESILSRDHGAFHAELALGRLCEKVGSTDEATVHYFGAVTRARAAGQWLSDEGVPPWLHGQVVHAMRTAQFGFRDRLFAALEPVKRDFGSGAVIRVESAIAIYLREVDPNYIDARQKPTFFYIPDLSTGPVYHNNLFPWIASLEKEYPQVRHEALNLLSHGGISEPFNVPKSEAHAAAALAGKFGKPSWNARFFYRHGRKHGETAAACPATSAVLDKADLCKITEHAPEVCFSLLTPGTHILPHRGVTNARLVCHLALVIPSDCALRVADHTLTWQEGRCFVFDDTFEHEAWNFSKENRLVLLMDVWSPLLTPAERLAIAAVIDAIGKFNIQCNLRPPMHEQGDE